ncbi:LacI family DNA-binding transcriptional regulator [Seonamhaeicola marinus]|uniref:LacI family transcriptional regulator n=1 Tax=Seonamhaeicola marinus TaxID=1912246 RepID=A0A5D0HYV3_9FLAO|nr:LacI family DNA-binding transcriptional regulator [Seonamhaeicola marinus]TYA74672.1 LacI family transcriptional regulator [Seonamhaeicola marinus]
MKNGDQVTIHDIARALNIDSSTVSRALNNSPRVSSKTKRKILDKANELGYQRNILASNLRTNKTNTIGVIVPRISRNFFSSVISGIEETAQKAGYNVIICQSFEDFERERQLVETLLSNRVDGILISISMQTDTYEHLRPYLKLGGSIVFYDRPCNFENCSSISVDDYKASFIATEHLIQNGCRNIVHFSGPQINDLYKNRKQGYIDALLKHGLEFKEAYCLESKLSENDGVHFAKKILEMGNVDGIYSSNDTAAIAAIQYLKSQGISIPKDIAVVGFNNDPISSVIEPALTTINQPDFEMGKMASTLLIDKIEKKTTEKELKVLDIELIVRNSSKFKS